MLNKELIITRLKFEIRWDIVRSKCSAECGEGVQTLKHRCVQITRGTGHRNIVDDAQCPPILNKKPVERCMGPCNSAIWTYEEWSQVKFSV